MALFLIMTAATLLVSPFLFESIGANIIAWIMLATVVASGIWIPLALQKKRYTHAFVGSSVMIAGMIGLGASGLFPRLVPSIPSLEYSRTIQNSSSSSIVLMLMLVVTALGLPMLVSYTVFIRRVANAGVMLPSND